MIEAPIRFHAPTNGSQSGIRLLGKVLFVNKSALSQFPPTVRILRGEEAMHGALDAKQ